MKVEYINPFIESIYDYFATMLRCEAKRGRVAVASEHNGRGDIKSLIGFSGPTRGTIVLSLPKETAIAIVKTMLGVEEDLEHECLKDGVAEAVNIVAGGAKAKFPNDTDRPINLSLPTVIWGNEVNVEYPSSATWLEVPFESNLGPFQLHVTFDLAEKSEGGAPA